MRRRVAGSLYLIKYSEGLSSAIGAPRRGSRDRGTSRWTGRAGLALYSIMHSESDRVDPSVTAAPTGSTATGRAAAAA